MDFRESVGLHERILGALGDDLVVSVAYDSGKYYVSVSTHKSSRYEFPHGGHMQSVLIDDKDKNKSVRVLAEQIISIYRDVLIEKEEVDGV